MLRVQLPSCAPISSMSLRYAKRVLGDDYGHGAPFHVGTVKVHLAGEVKEAQLFRKNNGDRIYWSPFTGERIRIPKSFRSKPRGKEEPISISVRGEIRTLEEKLKQSRRCPERVAACLCCGEKGWTNHHLQPRQITIAKGLPEGKTIPLCQTCHNAVHVNFSNHELFKSYDTSEKLIPALKSALKPQEFHHNL